MKVIVTRQNSNGQYDEVGMDNRRIIEYNSRGMIVREARKFARGVPVRIEVMDPMNMYRPAVKTFYVDDPEHA